MNSKSLFKFKYFKYVFNRSGFSNRMFSTQKSFKMIFNHKYISKPFCNLARLNFDKILLDKLDMEKSSSDILLNQQQKEFKKEEHIFEFGPEINWEKDVLQSEIPVVIDCYAE
jgi:hypothetical protein